MKVIHCVLLSTDLPVLIKYDYITRIIIFACNKQVKIKKIVIFYTVLV